MIGVFDSGVGGLSVWREIVACIPDVPTAYPWSNGTWVPRNYDERYHGPLRARQALACSVNVPAAQVLADVGPETLLDTLRNAGITTLTATARRGYETADFYRRAGTVVVLGGPHASALPGEALEHSDAVVVGEGEGVWPAVVADAAAGGGGRNLFALSPFQRRRIRNEHMGIVYQNPRLGLRLKVSAGGNIALAGFVDPQSPRNSSTIQADPDQNSTPWGVVVYTKPAATPTPTSSPTPVSPVSGCADPARRCLFLPVLAR